MKLSSATLDVLKNYATINQSILINKGNSLSTISNMKTVFSSVDVEEDFPVECAIYDLNKFIAKIALYGEDCDISFEEDRVVFTSADKRRSDNIKYASPKAIVHPDSNKKITIGTADCTFDLTEKDLEWQRKSASISGSPNFIFKSDGKKVYLSSTDVKDNSSDYSKTEIGKGNGNTFEVVMKVEYFKLMNGDYQVDISKRGLAQFTNKSNKVVYYIAIESAQSKFD